MSGGRRAQARPMQPGAQADRLVVFVAASNREAASFYSASTIVIPVTGSLTVEALIGALRARPEAHGMRYLEVEPAVPTDALLPNAPRLFRALCPRRSPSGTMIQISFGAGGRATPGQLQGFVRRICPRATLYAGPR